MGSKLKINAVYTLIKMYEGKMKLSWLYDILYPQNNLNKTIAEWLFVAMVMTATCMLWNNVCWR